MVGQNPQHTYCRDGIYYYCRRVPKDLSIRYDEKRIVMSLRTKSITAARRSAAAITSRLDDYWIKYGAGHDLEVKHHWMGRICKEYD